jgi:hypothetical protein
MTTVLNAFVLVPSTGWAGSIQRSGYALRSWTLDATGNEYLASFISYMEGVLGSAGAELSGFRITLTTDGFVKFYTSAGQNITVTLPTDLREILGFSSVMVALSGTAGTIAPLQPNHRLQLAGMPLEDLEKPEARSNTVYSDSAQYTYRYSLRKWREVVLPFSGSERATEGNEYIYAKRFWAAVLSKGVKFEYYPRFDLTVSAFEELSEPYGFQVYTANLQQWDPNQLVPGLYRDWSLAIRCCPAA